jgi:hypothetical protein
MINIDNIIKEFVEKKWSGKVVQVPRIWLTSVGGGLFYEVEGELTKHLEQHTSLYHKPLADQSSGEPERAESETIWYFGLQISKDEGDVVGFWIKEKM